MDASGVDPVRWRECPSACCRGDHDVEPGMRPPAPGHAYTTIHRALEKNMRDNAAKSAWISTLCVCLGLMGCPLSKDSSDDESGDGGIDTAGTGAAGTGAAGTGTAGTGAAGAGAAGAGAAGTGAAGTGSAAAGYQPIDLRSDCPGGCSVQLDPFETEGEFFFCTETDAGPAGIFDASSLCAERRPGVAAFAVKGFESFDVFDGVCLGRSVLAKAGDRTVTHSCHLRSSSYVLTTGMLFEQNGRRFWWSPSGTYRGASGGGSLYAFAPKPLGIDPLDCSSQGTEPCDKPGTLRFVAGADEGVPAVQLAGLWARCGRRIDLTDDPAGECDKAAHMTPGNEHTYQGLLSIDAEGHGAFAEDSTADQPFQYAWCNQALRELGSDRLAVWTGDNETILREEGPFSLIDDGTDQYLQFGRQVAPDAYSQIDIYYRLPAPAGLEDPCAVSRPELTL